VAVGDNGSGVDPTVGETIFDQGISTKPARGVGERGWGLALTRVVCEKRGGGVQMERTEGWTWFTARLPLVAPADQREASA
jgi:sensor histidine kinase regulating citrate/malate metabolism